MPCPNTPWDPRTAKGPRCCECMEQSYRKNAIFSPGSVSSPGLTQNHNRDQFANLRRPIGSALATNNAIDLATISDQHGLGSRSPKTKHSAQASLTSFEVPRARRRGLFARVTILAEIKDPYQYPYLTKWFIVSVAAYASAAGPMGSAIFFRMAWFHHEMLYPG